MVEESWKKIEVKVSCKSVTCGNWGPYNITALKPRIATSISTRGALTGTTATPSQPQSAFGFTLQTNSLPPIIYWPLNQFWLPEGALSPRSGVHAQNLRCPFSTGPDLKRQKPPNSLLDLNMEQSFHTMINHTLAVATVCSKNMLCTSQDIFAIHPSSFRFLFADSKDVFLISLPPWAFSSLLCRVCNHTCTHLERSFFVLKAARAAGRPSSRVWFYTGSTIPLLPSQHHALWSWKCEWKEEREELAKWGPFLALDG